MDKISIPYQGSIDPHVIIFAGWVDKANKKIVNKPIKYTDGSYYYDGIEENFGYGETVEHTPDQSWNYPYYPVYDSEGYYAWRFDAAAFTALGYILGTPSLPIQPSGLWTKPTPLDGNHITDKLTLAAIAFPTKKGNRRSAPVTAASLSFARSRREISGGGCHHARFDHHDRQEPLASCSCHLAPDPSAVA